MKRIIGILLLCIVVVIVLWKLGPEGTAQLFRETGGWVGRFIDSL